MVSQILVVDDESNLLEFLSLLFEEEGHEVTTAACVEEGREALADRNFDLVLCDVTMPDGSGLDLLREVHDTDDGAPPTMIMMTAYSSTKSAIEAMKLGAYDYVSKPFDVDELKLVVQKALAQTELVDENEYLRRELQKKYTFSNIIGKSHRMQSIFRLIEKISKTSSTVLIQGDSGTGKELIAKAIHYNSARAKGRFLSINCGAMPENLLESELFGHERGAFTGAVKDKKGLFQEAARGTLFLDEIGDMELSMQVKLLRALQEKVVRKVGGNTEERIDVRILSATNRDLEAMVAEGTFREDLYYRINVIPIQIPPLRHRREDIPLLVNHFLDRFSADMGFERHGISVEAMHLLENYNWPGNVRELENLVERTLALTPDSAITAQDLPAQVRGQQRSPDSISLPPEGLDLENYLEEIRAQLMLEALDRTDWIQTQAAELLGMSFRSFRYYAKKAGLTVRKEEEALAAS